MFNKNILNKNTTYSNKSSGILTAILSQQQILLFQPRGKLEKLLN